jgi:HSP20 family molecular chaperone IbpA
MGKKNSTTNSLVHTDRFVETAKSLEQKIRNKAYEIFQNREEHDGDAISDWLQARSEVLTTVALELQERDDAYVIEGELPASFAPEEISIDVSNGMFRVAGTQVSKSQSTKDGATSSSRSEVSFLRQMSLPADADTNGVDTRFDGGKLFVTLPKARART